MKNASKNFSLKGCECPKQDSFICRLGTFVAFSLIVLAFVLLATPNLYAQQASANAGSLSGSTVRAVTTNATFSAKNLEIFKDEGGAIEIALSNTIPVVAFQFDVKINPSVTVGVIELATRTAGMTIASGKISDGVYRVICYSLDGKSIIAGSDAVVRVNVSFLPDVVAGSSDIEISNAVVTINLEMDEATVTTAKGTLTIKDILYGDSNQDGTVDVNDVVNLVNYIVTGSSDPFNFKASDLNKDAQINVSDIIGIVAIILQPSRTAPSLRSGESGVYELSEHGFVLGNAPMIGGFEFAYQGDFTPSSHIDGFTIVKYEKQGEKRILAYSMTGGADLNAKQLFKGVTSMQSVLFVSPSGNEVALTEGGVTVGLAEPANGNQRIFGTAEEVVIDGFSAGESYSITDLSGRIVQKGVVKSHPIRIPTPTGHYLVTVGNQTRKVAVR